MKEHKQKRVKYSESPHFPKSDEAQANFDRYCRKTTDPLYKKESPSLTTQAVTKVGSDRGILPT